MRFEGQAVYVTGAGHGIGRATALRLAAEGAAVAVSDIDGPAAEAVAAELVAMGHRAFATVCDLTNRAAVDASIADAVGRFGQLNVLVNTAGGDWDEPALGEISDELFERKLNVNLTSVFRCVRAALPALIAAGPGSNVVSIGSINGDWAFGGYAYSAAKAGLEILTKNFAARYGSRGVRFNLISPGTIRTRNWTVREDEGGKRARKYPLGSIGEPEDIAAAVAFLASADASWITGVNLPVEGGIMTGGLHDLIMEG